MATIEFEPSVLYAYYRIVTAAQKVDDRFNTGLQRNSLERVSYR